MTHVETTDIYCWSTKMQGIKQPDNQPGIQATVAIHVSDSCDLHVFHTHCVAPPG